MLIERDIAKRLREDRGVYVHILIGPRQFWFWMWHMSPPLDWTLWTIWTLWTEVYKPELNQKNELLHKL